MPPGAAICFAPAPHILRGYLSPRGAACVAAAGPWVPWASANTVGTEGLRGQGFGSWTHRLVSFWRGAAFFPSLCDGGFLCTA